MLTLSWNQPIKSVTWSISVSLIGQFQWRVKFYSRVLFIGPGPGHKSWVLLTNKLTGQQFQSSDPDPSLSCFSNRKRESRNFQIKCRPLPRDWVSSEDVVNVNGNGNNAAAAAEVVQVRSGFKLSFKTSAVGPTSAEKIKVFLSYHLVVYMSDFSASLGDYFRCKTWW